MKFSFSNLLAITSLLVWASAWIATETRASSAPSPKAAPASIAALK